MAAASPTPMFSYGSGVGDNAAARGAGTAMRPAPHAPHRMMATTQRHGSPLSVLTQSHGGFSAGAPMMQSIGVATDSSDDEVDAPAPKLNPLTRSILENDGGGSNNNNNNNNHGYRPHQFQQTYQQQLDRAVAAAAGGGERGSSIAGQRVGSSPIGGRTSASTSPRLRISRNGSQSNTPVQDTKTPAPSLRIKRVPLRGAPMRRLRRTPQGDDDREDVGAPILPSSQDQENLVAGSVEPEVEPMTKSAPAAPAVFRDEKPVPLSSVSANTPRRPAPPPPVKGEARRSPPPPPKMSVLETATLAAGASTTKTKRRRNHITVNGKTYSQMVKIGKGGSADVYRVMAENGKLFALKRVRLEEADEMAVRGYKGEIDLLQKLGDVERVVRLYDYEIDEDKQILSLLMEIGEFDLSRHIRQKLDAESPALDLSFTRYYWKEMLECVRSIHEQDIVHSDLKPPNFLLISGRLKLIDFGIANAIDIDNTVNVHREAQVGTPNYMSPESLQDTNAGLRGPSGSSSSTNSEHVGKMMKLGKPSDVWSLGCILYQMVYGRPPFAHIPNQIHRVMAIINPKVSIEFPDLGVGGVRVPPGLRATLKKCLNRDQGVRPTVAQLLDERDAFLYPDSGEDLRIPVELLSQIIMRVAERFRDTRRGMPSDDEIRQYPVSFYNKIRELLEEG